MKEIELDKQQQTLMPPGVWLSDSDIIEENDQMLLMGARDNLRGNYFMIGDIANKYIMGNSKTGMFLSADRIYAAVARFVGAVAPRTVRYYAETAAFFSGEQFEAREVYCSLPFSFFDYARSTKHNCYKVLDYAAEHPFATLGEVKAFFADAGAQDLVAYCDDLLPPDEDWMRPRPTQSDSEGAPENSRQATKKNVSKYAVAMLLVTVSDLLDKLERIVEQIGLSDEVRTAIVDSVRRLRETVPLIARSAENNDV